MYQETREVLEKQIVELSEKLSKMDPGSKEFEQTSKAIADLAAKTTESIRVEYDYDYKVCASERDDKFRRDEMESKLAEEKAKRHNTLIIEGGKAFIEIFGIVVPIAAYAELLKNVQTFELQGIVSTFQMRNVLNNLTKFVRFKK